MFVTSRNFSQLRELISLADVERNNPEVILIGRRKHPETFRRQSKPQSFREMELCATMMRRHGRCLKERWDQEAKACRELADKLMPCPERDALLEKARQAETASRMYRRLPSLRQCMNELLKPCVFRAASTA